jgi:hypothetical protein
MTPTPSNSRAIDAQSIASMECTIPGDMTIQQWRRQRSARQRPARPCDHLHDTTTRYDPVEKQLSFLVVCAACGTERLVETQHYEPRFTPHPAPESPASGETVHHLPAAGRRLPLRDAA